MPYAQAMVERINVAYNKDNVAKLPQDNLDAMPFGAAAEKLGLATTAAEVNYLNTIPPSVRDAIRAALRSARVRGVRLQMLWAPGADFELTVSEVPGIPDSPGGISLLLKGPYAKSP